MNSLLSRFAPVRKAPEFAASASQTSSWFSKFSDAPRFPGYQHHDSHGGQEDETYYLAFVFEVAMEVINSVAGSGGIFASTCELVSSELLSQ